MHTLLIATEDSHFLFLRLFNASFQTLDSIKDRITQIFVDVFSCKPNSNLIDSRNSRHEEVFTFPFQDNVEHVGDKYQQRSEDWSSPKKDSNDRRGPELVFNVLDSMLKGSLERLKIMRESISWAQIGLDGYTLQAYYTQHVDIMRVLSLEGKLGVALWLQRKMIQEGVVPDVLAHNYLVNGFCKFGMLEKAEWLVSEMWSWGPAPNCATYNTLMKGYCAINNVNKAHELLSTMANSGVKPNRVTCNILVHALCKKGGLEVAKNLLGKLLDENSERKTSNLITSTILMDNCFKNGNIFEALTHWDEICQRCKEVDVVAYNVIIRGFCSSLDLSLAYKHVSKMFKSGLLPDNFTYNTLISGLCKVGWTDEACYLLAVMSRMGVAPDHISYKVLIQGLCINGDVVTAHEFLHCMLDNSIIPEPCIWNFLIDSYGKYGDIQKALAIKDQMMAYGVLPNVYTYNALIHMQIKGGNIAEAHSLKKEMLLNGLFPDLVTYNLLVGAAANFGHLHSALQVHDEMLRRGYDPDIVTYTELIKGYCMRGKLKDAEKVIDKIHSSDLLRKKIDHVPFLILMKKYCKMRELDSTFGLYEKWLRRE